MSESDDELQLRPETLAALKEFLAEKQEKQSQLNFVIQPSESSNDISFDEDWQLSQFWYADETTNVLVERAINCTPKNGRIALISCPTLYSPLKKRCNERQVVLLEYDERFKIYGSDFVLYDYKYPLNVPKNMHNQYDLVIADPPFLSEECLTKTATTIKLLSKEKIVLCTGAIMRDLVERLLNVKKCNFMPKHKNNLANEFYCYSNFNFDQVLK